MCCRVECAGSGDGLIAFDILEKAPESDPMINFDERDVLEYAEAAGFQAVTLTVEIEVKPHEPVEWEGRSASSRR